MPYLARHILRLRQDLCALPHQPDDDVALYWSRTGRIILVCSCKRRVSLGCVKPKMQSSIVMINPGHDKLSPEDRRFLISAINLHNKAAKKAHPDAAHGLHGLNNLEVSQIDDYFPGSYATDQA
jgi:hypothetical protein